MTEPNTVFLDFTYLLFSFLLYWFPFRLNLLFNEIDRDLLLACKAVSPELILEHFSLLNFKVWAARRIFRGKQTFMV